MNQTNKLKYVEADENILSQVFKDYPISSFINWTPIESLDKTKFIKRPIQQTNNIPAHMTLFNAFRANKSIGLVCNDQHNLIAIDIDGVDPKVPELSVLITRHPTYAEYSPSGKPNHFRLIYALPKLLSKKKLKRKTSFTPDEQSQHLELFNYSNNFVTLTGKALTIPALKEPKDPALFTPITIIEPDDLIDIFPSFASDIQEESNTKVKLELSKAPPININLWIDTVPCNRNDTKLIAFMTKYNLDYHNYWLMGIMAIHATFGSMNGFDHANAWSIKADTDYDFVELHKRWDTIEFSPELGPDKVTSATYLWMFNEFTIPWGIYKGRTKVPKPDEMENFEVFLKHKELTPIVDSLSGQVYLDGPDSALYPEFYPNKKEKYKTLSTLTVLAVRLARAASPYNFRPPTEKIRSWLAEIAQTDTIKVNLFAREIASQPAYDPSIEPDYFKILGTDIIQRNEQCEYPSQEFHELLVRKWLLSLGRNLWLEETMTNSEALPATSEGVLILSSPLTSINKSSFGIRLFPPEWRQLHVVNRPRFSRIFTDKDSVQKTIGKLVVDFDEAERVFSHNDTAELKSYLTERYDELRLPYSRDVEKNLRYFSCMASTNLTDLVFPREGARRYWWLNVKYIDTYAMDKMNMYNIWRQIRYELIKSKGKRTPYILNSSDIRYLESYLTSHTSTNSVEEILLDLYDFSPKGFAHFTTKERINGLKEHSMKGSDVLMKVRRILPSVGIKTLKEALSNLLKQAPDFYISGKLIKKGMYNTSPNSGNGQDRYFMPVEWNEAMARALNNGIDGDD